MNPGCFGPRWGPAGGESWQWLGASPHGALFRGAHTDVVQEGFPPSLAGARVPARDQLAQVKAMAGGMLIED
jgi:hypothetical protein